MSDYDKPATPCRAGSFLESQNDSPDFHTAAPPISAIQQEIEDQNQRVEKLTRIVDSLFIALGPVMRDEPRTDSEELPDHQVQVVNQIRNNTALVIRSNENLEYILNMLEV